MKTVIIWLALIFPAICMAQSIPNEWNPVVMRTNKVAKINEYRVSNGDTVLIRQFYFDAFGRIIETRTDYNRIQSLFIQTTYSYLDSNIVELRTNNPYFIQSSTKDSTLKVCCSYSISGLIIERKIEYTKGSVLIITYYYNDNNMLLFIDNKWSNAVPSKIVYSYFDLNGEALN